MTATELHWRRYCLVNAIDSAAWHRDRPHVLARLPLSPPPRDVRREHVLCIRPAAPPPSRKG